MKTESNLMLQKKVGRIVADDFRAATVFSNFGIDFCCKGGVTLEEACKSKGVQANDVLTGLKKIAQEPAAYGYHDLNLEELINHVIEVHHSYVQETLVILNTFLEKLSKVHGNRHPELIEIRNEIQEVSQEMESHMQKEERILFPFLIALFRASEDGFPLSKPHFKHVENPIKMMEEEHDVVGSRFMRIASLSDGYRPPADACQTYRVTYSLLQEFENDLHTHVHLENNMIFPQAIKMYNQYFGITAKK